MTEHENFIIGYPDDGSRKRDAAKGITTIDFYAGLVTHPDGTTTTLKKRLRNSGQTDIRSVVIFATVGTKIKLGHNNPVRVFGDQCNWNVFENISIHEMSIEITFGGTPDENDLQIIASTSRKAIYIPKVVSIHEGKRVAAQTSTDGYATVLERHGNQFNHHSLIIKEDGTNSITYKIEVKNSSSGTYGELQGDTVLDGATDIVQIQGVFHFYKISIKSTVGSSHGVVEADWMGKG